MKEIQGGPNEKISIPVVGWLFSFVIQRIKSDTKDYHQKLSLLQQMLVYSMKCKQTTDLQNTAHLKNLVKQFH